MARSNRVFLRDVRFCQATQAEAFDIGPPHRFWAFDIHSLASLFQLSHRRVQQLIKEEVFNPASLKSIIDYASTRALEVEREKVNEKVDKKAARAERRAKAAAIWLSKKDAWVEQMVTLEATSGKPTG